MIRKTTIAFVLVLAALIVWRVANGVKQMLSGAGAKQAAVATAVATTAVSQATIRDVAEFVGTLVPHSEFIVAPKIASRLEDLRADVGDTVRQGQLIAALDDAEYVQEAESAKAELAVAEAQVAQCESDMDVARREFDRHKGLGIVASESEVDQALARYKASEAKHRVALAQVQQQQAALRAAQVRLSYTQIHATWEDGPDARVVGERLVDQGTMLRANQPIVSILDISQVKAIIYVIERDYAKIRVGQTAALETSAYPGQQFTGAVDRVSPVLKRTSRQARVEVVVPNPRGQLKPGMFVQVRIEFARHADVTVAPTSAVVRRSDVDGVFLLDEAKRIVHFVPVKLGIVEGDVAEVLEPALAGRVVTLGQHLLEDGVPVLLPASEEREE